MNIYEMYMKNGRRYGFEVTCRRWKKGNKATVFQIGQTKEGDPLIGNPPYYGNPTVILKAEWMKHGYEINETGGFRDWELFIGLHK